MRVRDFESRDYDIKYYPTPDGDLPPANPSDMIIGEDDQLYFVKNKRIYYYNPKSDSIEHFMPEQEYQARSICSYGGRMYFSMWTGVYSIKEGEKSPRSESDVNVARFYVTKAGTLWLFSNTGIYYREITQGQDAPLVKVSNLSLSVLSVAEDENSNLIVGSLREGMVYIRKQFKPFGNYITGVNIDAMHESSSGVIYAGGVDGDLYTIRPTSMRAYESDNKPVNVTANSIISIAESPADGDLIMGLSGTSISVNKQADRIEQYDRDNNAFYGPTFRVFVDSIYCYQTTYSHGLLVYDVKSRKLLKKYDTGSTQLRLPTNIARTVFKDRANNLWIGTAEGLVRVSAESRFSDMPKYSVYRHSQGDKRSLSNNYIISVQEDLKGNIWAGTLGGGLNCLTVDASGEMSDNKIYNTENGLSNNMIKSIEVDDSGKVWVATNRGLNCIDAQSGNINIYNPSDGLQDYEFSELSSLKLKNGMLAFGGVNGVSIFDPKRITVDSIAPRVLISELSILNRRVTVGGEFLGETILHRAISQTDELRLPKKFNSFSFNFTSTHTPCPENYTYKYILEGFDEDWITTPATNRMARYTNIPPGNYRFIVKVANNDGVWSEHSAINICVAYPILGSPLAFVLYFVLLMMALYLITNDYKRRQRRINDVVLAKREKLQLKELSESKLRLFSNISHEFRTPLTLIMSTVQMLKQQSKISAEGRLRYVNIINYNSSIMMRLINELLDVAKFDNGQLDVSLQRLDVVSLASHTYDQFGGWMEENGILGSFSSSKQEILSMVDTHKMEEIIYNLMSNAIKHTPQGGEIRVSLREEDGRVFIEIFNSCSGIDKQEISHIFDRFYTKSSDNSGYGIGLALTKSLVELHDGTLSCDSDDGRGVTFTVVIPIVEGEIVEEMVAELENEESDTEGQDAAQVAQPTEHIEVPNEVNSDVSLNVLIVDDNRSILTLLSDILSPYYGVTAVKSAEEALEIAIVSKPSLIISDVMMDGMSGVELCSELKRNSKTAHIPIILLSAKGTNEDKIKGLEASADAYVVKPFDNNLLLSQISSLLKNRESLSSRFNISTLDQGSSVDKESDYELVAKALELVKDNVSNPELNVDFLCSNLGVCQITLNKRLKKYNNKTAIGFIRSIRMKYAAAMLDSGNYTIAEVTYAVGLSDLRHFRESFSKEFGMLPSEYISRVKNG